MARTLFVCEDTAPDSPLDEKLINQAKKLCTVLSHNVENLSFVLYGSFKRKDGLNSQIVQQFINNSQNLDIAFNTQEDVTNFLGFFSPVMNSQYYSTQTKITTHVEDLEGTNNWKLRYKVEEPIPHVNNPLDKINKLYHFDDFMGYLYRNYDSIILYHGGNRLNYLLSSLCLDRNSDEICKLNKIILFNYNNRLDGLIELYSKFDNEGLSTFSKNINIVNSPEEILECMQNSLIIRNNIGEITHI